MHTELHKLVFAEVLAQLVVNRVIDGEMIGREELGKPQGGSLAGRQILGVRGWLQRADGALVQAVVDGALVTQRDAASALIEEGDTQSHQLEQSGRRRSVDAQRRSQRAQRLGHCGKATHNGGDTEVDPVSLAKILSRALRRRRSKARFVSLQNSVAEQPVWVFLQYRRVGGRTLLPALTHQKCARRGVRCLI